MKLWFQTMRNNASINIVVPHRPVSKYFSFMIIKMNSKSDRNPQKLKEKKKIKIEFIPNVSVHPPHNKFAITSQFLIVC